MNTLLIDYDLNVPGQKYDKLIAYLKAQSVTWAKPMKSSFLIRTSKSAAQLLDEVLDIVDSNDAVLVTDVTGDAMAWSGLPADVTDWIKTHNGTLAYR